MVSYVQSKFLLYPDDSVIQVLVKKLPNLESLNLIMYMVY